MRLSIVASLALLAGILAGCQGADVGQDCTFGSAALMSAPLGGDLFATGVTSCDNLICIKSPSPTRSSAYCSKACASNADCSQSETGLVCRELTFSQNFFAEHPELQAQYQPYLGTAAGAARYCATPNQ